MKLKAWWMLFLQDIKKIFFYRVSFWIQVVGSSGAEILVAYLLWKAIFTDAGVEVMGGLTFHEMVQYYIVGSFLARMVRGPDFFTISQEIYDGSLTKYLIYPGRYFYYKLSERVAFFVMSLIQTVLSIVLLKIIFFSQYQFGLNFEIVWQVSLLVICASYLYFVMAVAIEMAAFWVDNVWSLSIMLRFSVMFFSGALLPLSLYPDWLQSALAFTPFPSMTYVPIKIILGQGSASQFQQSLGLLLCWILVIQFVQIWVWNRGVRQYSGVGQ